MPILKKFGCSSFFICTGLSILIAAILSFIYFKFRSIRLYVLYLSISILVFPIKFCLFSPARKIIFPKLVNVKTGKSLRKNNPSIIFIIFDEFPLATLLNDKGDINKELFPNFASLAGDSYWFKKATSVSDATPFSVPAILSGKYPHVFKNTIPVLSDHPRNLFTWLGGTYDIIAYEPLSRLAPRRVEKLIPGKDFKLRMKLIIIDTWYIYLHIIFPPEFKKKLPPIKYNWVNYRVKLSPDEKTSRTHKTSLGLKQWTKNVMVTMGAHQGKKLRHLIKTINYSKKPILYFMHICFPHYPWKFFPSGRRYKS